jgi:hypothetical protein
MQKNNMTEIDTMNMIDILGVVDLMAMVDIKGARYAFIFFIQKSKQECGGEIT